METNQEASEKSPKEEIKYLQDLSNLVFDLDQGNLQTIVDSTMNLFDNNFPISFNIVLIKNIFSSYLSQRKDVNVYLQYLQSLEKKEEEILKVNPQIFELFKKELLMSISIESNYFMYKLIENNLVSSENSFSTSDRYFVHLFTEAQVKQIKKMGEETNFSRSYHQQNNHISPLLLFYAKNKEDNFEQHKKNIIEGNTSKLSIIIRNDDVEQLQEISSNKEFDFNQVISSNIYEKFSKCSKGNVTLINYSAFYGSIKCFKYLLLNNADLNHTGKYAVAGGNIEIIHLCEQNGAKFNCSYKAAIKFHRNNIFYYLYENNLFKYEPSNLRFRRRKYFCFHSLPNDKFINPTADQQNETEEENKNKLLTSIATKSIQYNNFEIFSFIEKEGLEINDEIIEEAFMSGNIFFVKYLFDEKKISSEAFAYSVSSHNIELVKYVLDHNEINVNICDKKNYTPLFFACYSNDYDIVKLLLDQKGINVNHKSDLYQNGLMITSLNGHTEIVKLLLEQEGIEINAKDKSGYTALIFASLNGHTEIVKLLLEQRGIEINAKDNYGQTALIIASEKGHTEIVKLLLEQEGINISQQNNRGKCALTLSLENNYIEIVKLLLKYKDIDINIESISGSTPLLYACSNSNVEVVKLLINYKGIDINKCNIYRETPLMYATMKGNLEIVKLLLEQKDININAKTKDRDTALTIAVRNNYIEIVKLLLERKDIKINVVDNLEGTPLMYATLEGLIEIAKLLIEQKNIDFNVRNIFGETVLHKIVCNFNGRPYEMQDCNDDLRYTTKIDQEKFYQKYNNSSLEIQNYKGNIFLFNDEQNEINLIHKNQFEIFKLILDKKGVNVNITSYIGYTPLMTACTHGRTDIVKLLLEQKEIDVNFCGYGGGNAFMIACFNNHLETAKLLLELHKEIDINQKNNEGMNSLMGAAQNGHYDVVEFLVQQKGIKLNEVNNWGRTAIELASEFSKKDVKELLKKQKDIIFDDKMPETETKQTFGRYIPGTIYRVNANPIQPNKFG